jgi:hypothetical protein
LQKHKRAFSEVHWSLNYSTTRCLMALGVELVETSGKKRALSSRCYFSGSWERQHRRALAELSISFTSTINSPQDA